jgi:cyclase
MRPSQIIPRLVLPALLAFPAVAWAQGMENVTITTTDLGHGVAMLAGRGGNMGVGYGDQGVFLIDDEFAPLTEKILAAIHALSDKPVRFVINTHWHGDHTGGNENLEKTGAIIVSQENVRRRLGSDQVSGMSGKAIPPSSEAALPVVTFADSVTFHWNGEEIRVFHVEHAHTDGDAVIQFVHANVIHIGDILFNGGYPLIDLPAGGSVKGMIAAADRILALAGPDTKIIPGHGPLADRAALLAYRNMLAGVVSTIEPAVTAGKTLDEVKAMKPTAAYDDPWGKPFLEPDQFVEIVYKDLSR